MISVAKFSRKNLQSIVYPDDGGMPYYSALSPTLHRVVRELQPQMTDVVRPDRSNIQLMSFRNFQTVDLWWMVGMYNGIVNPFTEFVSGKFLIMPSLSSIQEYFRKIRITKNTRTIKLP